MRISDWSSDVCSSDLNATDTGSYAGGDAGFGGLAIVQQRQHTSHPWAMDAHVHDPESVERRQGVQRVRRRRTHETIALRSEERRVGKEWVSTVRTWWWPYN